LRLLRQKLPKAENSIESEGKPLTFTAGGSARPKMCSGWMKQIAGIAKTRRNRKTSCTLPLIDCGSCGAPSLQGVCEDVVNRGGQNGCVRKNENN
jgi:hypothetical protein